MRRPVHRIFEKLKSCCPPLEMLSLVDSISSAGYQSPRVASTQCDGQATNGNRRDGNESVLSRQSEHRKNCTLRWIVRVNINSCGRGSRGSRGRTSPFKVSTSDPFTIRKKKGLKLETFFRSCSVLPPLVTTPAKIVSRTTGYSQR